MDFKKIYESESLEENEAARDLYGCCSLSDCYNEDEWNEVVDIATEFMRKAYRELRDKLRFTLSDKESDKYADELVRYLLSDEIQDMVEL